MARKKQSRHQEPHAPLAFRGGAEQLMRSRDREVLLAGAAGTGKSICCIAKLVQTCEYIPKVRCLIVRKTRESLSESGLVTLEHKVLPPGHAALAGPSRKLRQNYRFLNGSEIVVGGMDKPSKILSTEYDLAYVQESTELKEEDWEVLLSRLGRNNRLNYHQLLADCNPDAPTHWLYRRYLAGRLTLIVSRHEDNPAMYDAASSSWLAGGRAYLETLDALTGPRHARLRLGEWRGTEGAVYPEWDPQVHVVDGRALPGWGTDREGMDQQPRHYPPPDWRRLWSVDFGYTNPFSLQFWAIDHDGRMYLYREIYHTGVLVEDHARRAHELWHEEARFWARARRVPLSSAENMIRPCPVVCDHDAEDRATLERHLGVSTVGARKWVRKGIQAVSERLRPAGDGRPRVFVVAGHLDRRDASLEDAKRPCGLVEEMGTYVWNVQKDAPVKESDHSCDALRYAINFLDGGFGGTFEAAETVPVPRPEPGPSSTPDAPRLLAGGPIMLTRPDQDRVRRGGRLFGGGA